MTPSMTLAISAKAKEMQRSGVDVVAFGAGEPDFDTPEFIRRAAHEAIDGGCTRYTPASGTPELKAAIVEKLKRENSLEYSPGEIIVSCGAKHALANVILALVDEGEEVLLPAPYWVSYPEMVGLAGGTLRLIPTGPGTGFKVRPEQIAEAANERTKLLILNSPSNPTGAVYGPEELESIGKVLLDKGIWCLSDEIYEKLVYGRARHRSIAEVVPEIKPRAVVVNGHSKAFAMTGWRIGYAAGPAEVIRAAGSIQSHTTSNPTSISQAAAVTALKDEKGEVEAMRREFEKRRGVMLECLSGIEGVSCTEPEGAFYVFPDVSALYGEIAGRKVGGSVEFAKVCLEEAHVALIPGAAFGEDSCVRLSYAAGLDRIEEGVRRLRELFS